MGCSAWGRWSWSLACPKFILISAERKRIPKCLMVEFTKNTRRNSTLIFEVFSPTGFGVPGGFCVPFSVVFGGLSPTGFTFVILVREIWKKEEGLVDEAFMAGVSTEPLEYSFAPPLYLFEAKKRFRIFLKSLSIQ